MIPAAAGILAAGMMYLPVWWQNLQAEQEKENWIDTYLKPEDPAEPEETGLDPEQQERMEPDDDPLQRQFDFEGLQRVNPDIVGWIYLPGTQIDEPVCRGTDNHFYLTHTAGKAENPLGAIFVPPETGKDLADAHVLFTAIICDPGKGSGSYPPTARSRSRGSTRTFTSTRRMDPDAERCTVCTRRTATVMRTRLDISWRQMRMQSGRKEPQSSPYMTVDQYRTADSRSLRSPPARVQELRKNAWSYIL